MQTHPSMPRLVMCDDAELAKVVGAEVANRTTIHAWPLSWVQRLEFADGRTFAYKSQLPPTVEPEFYEAATSPLLLGHRVLDRYADCSTMLIDWLDAPGLSDLPQTEVQLVRRAREVVAQIGEIAGDLPAYLDLGTTQAWSSATGGTLQKLHQLVADGRFPSTDLRMLEELAEWVVSPPVLDKLSESPRVVHGDLRADQIFVTDAGYRIVDWQRPVIAPPEVDLVSLLTDLEIDPRPHVDASTRGIERFVLLHWAVVAQYDLFPTLDGSLFDEWSSSAIRAILDLKEEQRR
ncbi:phosphotransferase [Actinopolymorpha pittospori]